MGSSSGCIAENPYVIVPRGLVNRESVKPVLMPGTIGTLSIPNEVAVAERMCFAKLVSNGEALGLILSRGTQLRDEATFLHHM